MFIRVIKIVLGGILVITGVVGLLIPIMPGWLFIFPGLAMIYPEKGEKVAVKIKERIQKISQYFE